MARYKTTLMDDPEGTTVIVEGRALGGRIVREFITHVKDADIPAAVESCMDVVREKVEPKE